MQKLLVQYLAQDDKSKRLQILKTMQEKETTIPVDLSEDLLYLSLDHDESNLIIDLTDKSDLLLYEHFLTNNLDLWHQNISTYALRKWAENSDHLLWQRLLSKLKKTSCSQRMRYTLLDLCIYLPGKISINEILSLQELNDFSPAFHALLFQKCLQWQISDPRLIDIGKKIIFQAIKEPWPENKALMSALQYLYVFDKKSLDKTHSNKFISEPWNDYLKTFCTEKKLNKKDQSNIENKLKDKKDSDFWNTFLIVWPSIYRRQDLQQEFLTRIIKECFKNLPTYLQSRDLFWTYFSGINETVLQNSILEIDDGICFANIVSLFKGLLSYPVNIKILNKSKAFLKTVDSPLEFLEILPLNFRLSLQKEDSTLSSGLSTRHTLVLKETKLFLDNNFSADSKNVDFRTLLKSNDDTNETRLRSNLRHAFFDLAFKESKKPLSKKDDREFWSLLAHNWQEPQLSEIDHLAALARQQASVFHLAYIRTLGRFTGSDPAVLKLLDYIRSTSSEIISELIFSLANIGTPRALQELTSCLTRPNINGDQQLEICSLIKDKDLTSLQLELKSAFDEIHLKSNREENRELSEALLGLIVKDAKPGIDFTKKIDSASNNTDQNNLDIQLNKRFETYSTFSSEVKRAFRTAQFFNNQVDLGKASHSIDLSPVVDMQYKALELVFRESFEDMAFKIISNGILQSKLDIIGYLRPIPRSMDTFENYLGSLPIICQIPYFSKFKLRKMLRAISQFRPGRRFTLDGIKAFALFFLCFGRLKCQYGLNGILSLGFSKDEELFDFCHSLHIFQDFRNRAAHEGFRPEERKDIEGIWGLSSKIISSVDLIKKNMKV